MKRIEDYISSQPHMIRYEEKFNVCNNSAHDLLVERQCLIGKMLSKLWDLEVPTQYKVMGGINIISATCGAHSAIVAGGKYPLNTWILLVGPSAGRKSSAMIPFQGVMQSCEQLRSLTLSENTNSAAMRAPLEDSYENAVSIFEDEEYARVNGTFYAQEFNDFFDVKKDDTFSSFFTKLWGDQPFVRIDRVGLGHFELNKPTVSLFGAIQTARVPEVIPISQFRQGFFPRMLPIFSNQSWEDSKVESQDWVEGSRASSVMNQKSSGYDKLLIDFKQELINLSRSYFICGFSEKSVEKYNSLTLPNLPIQMQEYVNRRTEHFRKICGIVAISRAWGETFESEEHHDRIVVVTENDVEIAHKIMMWNDSQIIHFCRETIRSPDTEMYERLEELIRDNNGTINENQLKEFMRVEVPSNMIKTKESVLKNYVIIRTKVDENNIMQYKMRSVAGSSKISNN